MLKVTKNVKVTLPNGKLATMPKDVGGVSTQVEPWVEYDVPTSRADVLAMMDDPAVGETTVCEWLKYAIDLKARAKLTGQLKTGFKFTDDMADQCLARVMADDDLRAAYAAVCATVSWQKPTSLAFPREFLRATWFERFAS